MTTVHALPMHQWLTGTRAQNTLVAYRGKTHYTLGMLSQHVSALCHTLSGLPLQRWALYFEDSYLFTVALLAVLHSGKIPVIPGEGKPALLREQSHLFDGFLTDTAISLDVPTLPVGHFTDAEAKREVLPAMAEDAYIVLFTSGSTGQPRQIRKSIASLDSEAGWLANLWGQQLSGCRFTASVTHQHLYGLTFRIMLPMALACAFSTDLILFPEQLSAIETGYTYALISSPAFLKRLDRALPAPHCRFVLSAGGPLPWDDATATAQWLQVMPHEIYGSTEAGVIAWRQRSEDAMPWQPFTGVRLSQVGAEEDPVWHVQSALIDDPEGLLLDDRLDFTPGDGRFHLRGRRDRVVKIEEKRISLTNIETRTGLLSGIADVAAVPVTRSGRVHIGVVVVLDDTGNTLLAQQGVTQLTRIWRDELRLFLEAVAVPRYWRIVDAIPVNKQSKRIYPELQELFDAAS